MASHRSVQAGGNRGHLLAEAAEATNTIVKLSGLNTAAAPGAPSADFRRYIDHALHVFGPERAMYGGDWPFALLAARLVHRSLARTSCLFR